MMEERTEDPELDKLVASYKTATSKVEELVEAGMGASKKSYFEGKKEVFQRLLANLDKLSDGFDSFFMENFWQDVRHSSGEDHFNGNVKNTGEDIEQKYSLSFLKKRARPDHNPKDEDEETHIDLQPGGPLKPVKKTHM